MLSPVQVPEHLMTTAARRAEIGANQLPAPRRRLVLAEFGAQSANMFAVVLMVAAGITFVAYALTTPRSSANLVLAIGILGPCY
jgi:Ca2+-transporting ATPase